MLLYVLHPPSSHRDPYCSGISEVCSSVVQRQLWMKRYLCVFCQLGLLQSFMESGTQLDESLTTLFCTPRLLYGLSSQCSSRMADGCSCTLRPRCHGQLVSVTDLSLRTNVAPVILDFFTGYLISSRVEWLRSFFLLHDLLTTDC